MDALIDRPAQHTRGEAVAGTALAGIGGGIALGALDLFAQRVVPYPWGSLANSSAVWAVAAFALGRRLGPGTYRAVVGAVLMLAVAVETYYFTAAVMQHDAASNLITPTTQTWLAFAVLAGALFGWAGAASRDSATVPHVVGIAMPAAVLIAEGLRRVRDELTDQAGVAALEAVLAVALVLGLARTNRQRALALLACVPLTMLAWSGYVAAHVG